MDTHQAMSIELGSTMTHTITGYTGVVTARCEYMNGCVQLELQPRQTKSMRKGGEFPDSQWLDCQSLVIVEAVDPESVAGVGGPTPGTTPTFSHA